MNAVTTHRRLLVALATLSLLLIAGTVTAGPDAPQGYLGVMLQDISPSMAKALKLGDNSGVLIADVVKGSPAEDAGLDDGDVILEFNGKTIDDASALTAAVRGTEPGDKATLQVLREGKQEKVKVVVGERNTDQEIEKIRKMDQDHPDMQVWQGHDFSPDGLKKMMGMADEDRGYLGIGLADLTEQLGGYFGVKDGAGVLVTEVREDSPAAAAGLKAGDVITKIDDQDTPSTEDLMEAMGDTEPDQTIHLSVLRQGKEKSFKATLAKMPKGLDHPMMKGMFFGDDGDEMVPPFSWNQHPGCQYDNDNVIIHRSGKGKPEVRILRKEFDDQEIDKLHQELDQLREQLDQLKQEFNHRK